MTDMTKAHQALPQESIEKARVLLHEGKKIHTVGEEPVSWRRVFAYTLGGLLAINNIGFLGDGVDQIALSTMAVKHAFFSDKVTKTPQVVGEKPAWIEQSILFEDQSDLQDITMKNQRLAWESQAKEPFTYYLLLQDQEGAEKFPDPGVDLAQLIHFFIEKEIPPKAAMVIVSHIQIAQSVSVLGKNDPYLIEKEKSRQDQSFAFLQQAWDAIENQNKSELQRLVMEAASDTHVRLNLEKMTTNFIHEEGESGSALLSTRDFIFNNNLPSDEYLDQYMEVGNQALQPWAINVNRLTQENVTLMSYQAMWNSNLLNARQDLMDAVQEAGIASLRIPGEVGYNVLELHTLALNIRGINNDLKMFTGWDGQVLGMNYRLILDLDQAGGSAYTYSSDDGFLHIKTFWDKLPHEWQHLVDFTQNEYVDFMGWGRINLVPMNNHNNPKYGELTHFGDKYKIASITADLWKGLNNPELSLEQREDIQAEIQQNISDRIDNGLNGGVAPFMMKTENLAANTVVQNGSPWMNFREHAIGEFKKTSFLNYIFPQKANHYLGSPTEVLAFSFAGTIDAYFRDLEQNQQSPYRSVVLAGKKEQMKRLASYEPTHVESLATVSLWQNYYNELGQWWKDDTLKRQHDLSSLEQASHQTIDTDTGDTGMRLGRILSQRERDNILNPKESLNVAVSHSKPAP